MAVYVSFVRGLIRIGSVLEPVNGLGVIVLDTALRFGKGVFQIDLHLHRVSQAERVQEIFVPGHFGFIRGLQNLAVLRGFPDHLDLVVEQGGSDFD